MSSQNVCSICLETTQARGGVPLFTPGCCGKWFHVSCAEALAAAGNNKCPDCRAPIVLPGAAAQPHPAPPVTRSHARRQAPAPVQQQQQPPANNSIFSFGGLFGGGHATTSPFAPPPPRAPSAVPSNQPSTVEDPVDPYIPDSKTSAAFSSTTMELTTAPEYPITSVAMNREFYARTTFCYRDAVTADSKVPLDVVCILDNSGSMQGSKLASLKKAMEFVIDSLSPQDRLSVVKFNSFAEPLHGLLKLTPTNKALSRSHVRSVQANGGTNILQGMRAGWSLMSNRKSFNPSSCVFLLTDGQDGSNMEAKKSLAREIKASGSSLFVFGFGADHDSAQMQAIADAAEANFTYIDTDDTVIDAFGGAIGSQQGISLKHLTLSITAVAPGVLIRQTIAGNYTATQRPDLRGVTVSFANMYPGETRDVLVKLELPNIDTPQEAYPLITANLSYFAPSNGGDGTSSIGSAAAAVVAMVVDSPVGPNVKEFFTDIVPCTVARINDTEHAARAPTIARDSDVDVQINRTLTLNAIKDALAAADRSDYNGAKEIITSAIATIRESVSFKAGLMKVVTLMDDLEEALRTASSREEYTSYGGRAKMSEAFSSNACQRGVYTKAGKSSAYQNASSAVMQSKAKASKGGFF